MPTYTDDTIEGGTFTNSFANNVASTLLDGGHTIWDCVYPVVASILETSGVFTSSLADYHATLLVEHGTFTDSFSAQSVTSINMVEHGVFTDKVLSEIEDALLESGVFTDSFDISLISFTVENGQFADSTDTGSSLSNTLVEHGVFHDSQRLALSSVLADSTGTFSDATTHKTTIVTLVVESGQFATVSVSSNISIDKLIEHGILTDAVVQILASGSNDVVEAGVFDDTTAGGGGGAGNAWHAHLEAFPMSRFDNYGFQSMAVVDGVLMGVNSDGAFLLSGGADDGLPIAAYVEHDWDDKVLNAKTGEMQADWHVKRPRYAYINGQVYGDISVTVGYVDDVGNEIVSAPYVFPAKSMNGVTNNRVELGRGIRSRLLSLRLQNENGGSFKLNDGKLVVDTTDRSI